MIYQSLSAFLRDKRSAIAKGPTALVLVEDAVAATETVDHHLKAGFGHVVAIGQAVSAVSEAADGRVSRVQADLTATNALIDIVNAVIVAAPGTWLYYCYNAEFLFHPFCETRSVREMLTFHSEERRHAMLTYVIDLYAGDLDVAPNAVNLTDAHLDRTGYYALARRNGSGGYAERQLDFYGALRWRFEEHIPAGRRRIDRISLFRAKPGLRLRADHTFNDDEYNTYACPWHHNVTAAICSFRTAKALRSNPGSGHHVHNFRWHNSVPFSWGSQQLMELGLMEPGQWF